MPRTSTLLLHVVLLLLPLCTLYVFRFCGETFSDWKAKRIIIYYYQFMTGRGCSNLMPDALLTKLTIFLINVFVLWWQKKPPNKCGLTVQSSARCFSAHFLESVAHSAESTIPICKILIFRDQWHGHMIIFSRNLHLTLNRACTPSHPSYRCFIPSAWKIIYLPCDAASFQSGLNRARANIDSCQSEFPPFSSNPQMF